MFGIFFSETAHSENYLPKNNINGSGLKIPRIVSLKNSLTYMRSGPGKKYPITFEIKQKGYPLKIISEFNNWRKVTNSDKLIGWIHTQMLSSFKTGIIIKTTLLKKIPSEKSKSEAKLLANLVVNIKKCELKWCKIEIIKDKAFVGWVKKTFVWGAVQK
ncbi:SH3 domain-containing protein [Alphaproteobacteria bacterium]|nr:SH3 domain-containing protein [Alphaproteobacteria bacterium]